MQRLAQVAMEIEPESPDSRSELGRRLNISDWEERRRALAEIFFVDRASAQYETRDDDDLDVLVQTVIPQTRSIPVRHLPECYVVALEQRPASDNYQIRGVELLNAWKVIQGRVEMESSGAYDKSRMLTANAVSVCPKCDGTGWERTPKGRKKGCDHAGWTPEFETELERSEEQRREDVRKQAEFMREALSKVGSPKPAESATTPQPPAGVWLKCSKCPRKINVLYVDEPGRKCGALLNASTSDQGDDGEVGLCDGTLEVL